MTAVTHEIHGRFDVVAKAPLDAPWLRFPIPREYHGQVPVSFELEIKPASAAVSRRVVPGACGDRIVEVVFAPMRKGAKVGVEWRSRGLAEFNVFDDRPQTAPFPDRYPASVASWLRPSPYVQSDDPRIVAAAAPLRGGDVIETISKTLAGNRAIVMRQKGRCKELSAVEALTRQGSCVSAANLLAALLRANGIPARLLAGYPLYSGRPIQTHYVVEAYVPGYDWLPLEPSLGRVGWSAVDMPIVAVAPVEHEAKAMARANVAPGVPYLTLNETDEGLNLIGRLSSRGSDHEVKGAGVVTLTPGLLTRERERWSAWLARVAERWENLVSDLPPQSK